MNNYSKTVNIGVTPSNETKSHFSNGLVADKILFGRCNADLQLSNIEGIENHDVNTNFSQIEKNLFFSDEIYTPEALLSAWLNLSFFSVTAALIFYNMTVTDTFGTDPRISAFLAIALMTISCAYVYFSLGPFWRRMNYIENICKKAKVCSGAHLGSIQKHKLIYTVLGYATIFIDFLVVLVILNRTRKLMAK